VKESWIANIFLGLAIDNDSECAVNVVYYSSLNIFYDYCFACGHVNIPSFLPFMAFGVA